MTARDRGMVTAETAVVLPVLVLALAAALAVVGAALLQVRCLDAAAAAARLAARGEPAAVVTQPAAAIVGATVQVRREQATGVGWVTVTVTAPVPVVARLPLLRTVRVAETVTEVEEPGG